MDNKIFYTNLGATMVLPTFYQVVRETPKTMKLVELTGDVVEHIDGFRGRVLPGKENLTADGVTARWSNANNAWMIKVHSSRFSIEEWDGKSKYFDHLD